MMEITIYGAEGCSKCSNLKEKTEEAVQEMNVDAEVEKVGDMAVLAEKGIMSTPAFEIDDEMVFSGDNPPKDHVKELIEEQA